MEGAFRACLLLEGLSAATERLPTPRRCTHTHSLCSSSFSLNLYLVMKSKVVAVFFPFN